MTIPTDYDFAIHVQPQMLEVLPEVASLYEGIYSVTLNHLITVLFVPEVSRNPEQWPPMLPEDLDFPSSITEARLWTIGLSKHTVVPNSDLAGQEEIINFPPPLPSTPSEFRLKDDSDNSMEHGVIFYVTPQEFARFSEELAEVRRRTTSIRDKVDASEISELGFVRLLVSRIIASEHFSQRDLEVLERHKSTK
jgi:hypothetical protein